MSLITPPPASYFNGGVHMSSRTYRKARESSEIKKLQVEIDSLLHHDFKVACIVHDTDMRTTISWLIEQWLIGLRREGLIPPSTSREEE